MTPSQLYPPHAHLGHQPESVKYFSSLSYLSCLRVLSFAQSSFHRLSSSVAHSTFFSQHVRIFIWQSRTPSRNAVSGSEPTFPCISSSSWRYQHPAEVSLAPDCLWFRQFWLFFSKRKRPQDDEDKENESSDDVSKNYYSFGRVYSRQSCPFNTVDSVVNFGIKHEASESGDDDSDIERKKLTTLWVNCLFDCMLRLKC